MDKRLPTIIAIVITTAWAVSFIIDIISPSYEPPATLHALMMIVAGAAFGATILPKRNGKDAD